MHKFTVKRSEWNRGQVDSCLLRGSDNLKCCLGFYLLSKGFTKDDILYQYFPVDVILFCSENHNDPMVDTLNRKFLTSSSLALKLMQINDNADILDDEREELLKDRLLESGIEVTFVD